MGSQPRWIYAKLKRGMDWSKKMYSDLHGGIFVQEPKQNKKRSLGYLNRVWWISCGGAVVRQTGGRRVAATNSPSSGGRVGFGFPLRRPSPASAALATEPGLRLALKAVALWQRWADSRKREIRNDKFEPRRSLLSIGSYGSRRALVMKRHFCCFHRLTVKKNPYYLRVIKVICKCDSLYVSWHKHHAKRNSLDLFC